MYVVGYGDGLETAGNITECEKYNPVTNAWSPIAPLQDGRMSCKLAAIGNKIYCLGGSGRYGFGQYNEVYDISTNKWSPFPYIEMVTACSNSYFGALNDKLFYLSETVNPSADTDFEADEEHRLDKPFRLVQCFDPATNKWTAKSPEYGETTSPPGKAKDCIFVINVKDQFVYDMTRNTWEKLPTQQCGGVELSFQGKCSFWFEAKVVRSGK